MTLYKKQTFTVKCKFDLSNIHKYISKSHIIAYKDYDKNVFHSTRPIRHNNFKREIQHTSSS